VTDVTAPRPAAWLKAANSERVAGRAGGQQGDRISMVAVMSIEKHAAFYRAYQPHERSLVPVAVVLATMIALWLLVYLLSALGPYVPPTASPSQQSAALTASQSVR
jgi:hypothetical protein